MDPPESYQINLLKEHQEIKIFLAIKYKVGHNDDVE